MRMLVAALLFLLASTAALAQPVTVIGPVTPGNLSAFNSPTVLKDSGLSSLGFITCTALGAFPVGTGSAAQCSNFSNSTAQLVGGPLTITTTGTTAGFNISQNGPASGAGANFNIIGISTDGAATGSNGLSITHNFGGPNTGSGAYQGLFSATVVTVNPNNGSSFFAVGAELLGQANVPGGGTNTAGGALGSVFGSNPVAQLLNTAINYAEVTGEEINVSIASGASARTRAGVRITELNTSVNQGAVFDEAIQLTSQVGAAGWKVGVGFDASYAHAPLATSGTAIAVIGAQTMATFIDASALTATNFIKGPNNFVIDGNGGIVTFSALVFSNDTFFGRRAAASFLLGQGDAASPIAQTLTVQGVGAGTSNTAGAVTTFKGSTSTGNAVGGGFSFQVTPAGGSGTSQNTYAPALTILGNTNVGIGTETNPQGPLVVSSNTSVGAAITSVSPTQALYMAASGTNTIVRGWTFTNSAVVQPNILTNLQAATIGGTPASPSNTKSTQTLGRLALGGYDGTIIASCCLVQAIALNDWSGSDHSGYLSFLTTASGATANGERMRIYASGGVAIGNTIADPGAGNFTVGTAGSVAAVGGNVISGRTFTVIGNNQATFGFQDSNGTAGSKIMGLLYDGLNVLTAPGLIMQNLNDSGVFVANNLILWRHGGITMGNNVSTTDPGTGIFQQQNTTDATSTSTGAMQNKGGMSVNKRVWMNGLTTSAAAQTAYACISSGGEVISVAVANTCASSSDLFKQDQVGLELGLDVVVALKPIAYHYQLTGNEHFDNAPNQRDWQLGFSAQQAASVNRLLVTVDGDGNLHGFRYEQYAAVLTRAIQELKEDNDNLHIEIELLKRAVGR